MDFLKESVKIAIRKSLDSLASAHPGESVCGYALLTDDDLQCLDYHAITMERLEKGGSELRFQITDWPYADGSDAFDQPRELMVENAEKSQERYKMHVDACFGALVVAMKELRDSHVFHENVFLTVASTDPSDYLERLEHAAVQNLNSDSIFSEWQAWISMF